MIYEHMVSRQKIIEDFTQQEFELLTQDFIKYWNDIIKIIYSCNFQKNPFSLKYQQALNFMIP
jgi:hypothetical protein